MLRGSDKWYGMTYVGNKTKLMAAIANRAALKLYFDCFRKEG